MNFILSLTQQRPEVLVECEEISTGFNGGIDEDRTRYLLNANQVLSQMSYDPIYGAPGSNRTAI